MSTAAIYFSDDRTVRHDREYIIFVEGTDDAHFLDVILSELNADPLRIGIVIVGGTGNFAPVVQGFKKTPSFKQNKGILVLRDADDSPAAALRDTNQSVFKGFEVNLTHATFVEKDSRRLGVYLFPWLDECGDLERLCLSTVAGTSGDRLAEEYMVNAQESGQLPQLFKRKAQVYLAAIPGTLCRGAGMAFKRDFFDATHTVLDPLKQFLRGFLHDVIAVPVAQRAAQV